MRMGVPDAFAGGARVRHALSVGATSVGAWHPTCSSMRRNVPSSSSTMA